MRYTSGFLIALAACDSFFVPLPFSRRRKVATRLESVSSIQGDVSPSMMSTTTLAGPFLVRCTSTSESCTFSCYLIDDVPGIEPAFCESDGARAWGALHDRVARESASATTTLSPTLELVATFEGKTSLRVTCVPPTGMRDEAYGELQRTLCCVLAQWASQRLRRKNKNGQGASSAILVALPDDRSFQMEDGPSDATVHEWFGSLDLSSEVVEMVDRDGVPLGAVPRPLVHRHNLLHRGIGMFVTADQPIGTARGQSQPSVYVHRRTSTKRIFPSLYDMFVGGVSLAGEVGATTALREVAEELGLSGNPQQLSDPLLTCVVCTAYNRCVVVLFSYTMNQAAESIHWQEEEVAWGSFVPYEVVVAAADRSILRLVDRNAWPGRVPPIQSPLHGHTSCETDFDWASWDIVPDGLLVWEAWLRWLEGQQAANDLETSHASALQGTRL